MTGSGHQTRDGNAKFGSPGKANLVQQSADMVELLLQIAGPVGRLRDHRGDLAVFNACRGDLGSAEINGKACQILAVHRLRAVFTASQNQSVICSRRVRAVPTDTASAPAAIALAARSGVL